LESQRVVEPESLRARDWNSQRVEEPESMRASMRNQKEGDPES
jgi:hypothetical protein